MNIKRFSHNLVLLKTGKILAIGGFQERSCELFDPVTETWTMTDSIPTMRFYSQSITELKDGRILVSGGYRNFNVANSAEYLAICEIYDPVTDKWLPAAPLNVGRYSHTATLLNNGEVLIAGGFTKTVGALRSCEIYNPTNNTWSISISLNESRSRASSILLPNGNVFISGRDSTGVNIIPWEKSSEVFDVIRRKWFYVENMFDRRVVFPIKKIFDKNSVKLYDERIILIGGEEFDIINGLPVRWSSKSSHIFDLVTSVEDSQPILLDYIFYQNYPNPFNPTTEIKYSLPKSAYTKLDIYDALGRFVKSLVNSYQNTGNYHIQFIAKELPCGIYFYRLLSGTYSETN